MAIVASPFHGHPTHPEPQPNCELNVTTFERATPSKGHHLRKVTRPSYRGHFLFLLRQMRNHKTPQKQLNKIAILYQFESTSGHTCHPIKNKRSDTKGKFRHERSQLHKKKSRPTDPRLVQQPLLFFICKVGDLIKQWEVYLTQRQTLRLYERATRVKKNIPYHTIPYNILSKNKTKLGRSWENIVSPVTQTKL